MKMNFRAVSGLAGGLLLLAWSNMVACGSSKSAGTPDGGEISGGEGGSSGAGGDDGSSSGSASSGGITSGAVLDSGIPVVWEAGPPVPDGGVPWPSPACVTFTAHLVSTMTRLQKAQQMVLAPSPSNADVTQYAVTNLWAPGTFGPTGWGIAAWAAMTDGYRAAAAATPLQIPLLYAVNPIHGMAEATGAVVFPHNIGMASSRNASFVYQAAQIEASEILAGGINWTYAPFAGTTWDYRWGRVYESFSEDPTWTGEMLTAEIQGYQGVGGLGSATNLMVCAKHAAGDGQMGPPSAKGGVVDRGDIVIDTPTMEVWGLAQYIPAIQAGLA